MKKGITKDQNYWEEVGEDFLVAQGAHLFKHKNMKNTKLEQELGNDVLSSNSLMLSQIAGEVEEYCEHPDCTTLQAVQLMKCKLKEYEIKDIRNQIYKSWKK